MTRTSGVSLNAGTFSPKKYIKYTVEHTTNGSNSIATYSYFGKNDVLIAKVEIEFDGLGRDIRGELVE
jgi:hypothetical protein